ncbi:hypothetical protein KIN20_032731 [Parelaphostrongylus tenuis]|uniref:BPTI/Kunitz inhibitor domain-containing protein n=1 Tax=Parelaphostrongylus tenuis TaxID=148309 RepID=A0AAD5R7I2_PARTN|nr:hypothetical protein KIN20_032731 [Parelaphostrongylus tenuis]
MTQPTIRWYLNENGTCEYYPWGYCPGDRVVQSSTIRTKAECERECKLKMISETAESAEKSSNIGDNLNTTEGTPVNGPAISTNDIEGGEKPIESVKESSHAEEEHETGQKSSDNGMSNEPSENSVIGAGLNGDSNTTNADDGAHNLGKQETVSDIINDDKNSVVEERTQSNERLSVSEAPSSEKSSTDDSESKSQTEAASSEEGAHTEGQHVSTTSEGSSTPTNFEDQITTPSVLPTLLDDDHSTTTEGEVVHVEGEVATEQETSTEKSSTDDSGSKSQTDGVAASSTEPNDNNEKTNN